MNNILELLLKEYPIIIKVIVLSIFLITKNNEYLYLFTLLILSKGINYILKYFIFKPLMGKKIYPIIGSGERPGKKGCSTSFGKTNKITYGMPSGHSQFAVFFSTYILLMLNTFDLKDNIKLFIKISLILIALIVMYSRIIFKCHTYQQIILGGMIGYVLSKYFYFSKFYLNI